MPLYEIEHYNPLHDQQKEDLAQLITRIHSRLFTTPSLFVNVRFISKSHSSDQTFIGGKRRNLNRIIAYVRPGPSRTTDDYRRLCDAITTAWNRVMTDWPCTAPIYSPTSPKNGGNHFNNNNGTSARPSHSNNVVLHGIYVMGSIIAGTEAGFSLPAAGEDKQWCHTHLPEFEERARYGDEDFRALLKEIRDRPDLHLPPYSHQSTPNHASSERGVAAGHDDNVKTRVDGASSITTHNEHEHHNHYDDTKTREHSDDDQTREIGVAVGDDRLEEEGGWMRRSMRNLNLRRRSTRSGSGVGSAFGNAYGNSNTYGNGISDGHGGGGGAAAIEPHNNRDIRGRVHAHAGDVQGEAGGESESEGLPAYSR